MSEETLQKEIASLRSDLAQLRKDLKLHTHNGFDTGKDFESPNITGAVITGGTIQTSKTGLRLVMSGSNGSYEFRGGDTLLAELKSTSVPFSGLGGAAIIHGTGAIMIEISGQGEGLGSRQIMMTNAAGTKYFGFVDNDAGGFGISSSVDIEFAGTGASGGLIMDQKNAVASALSGTQRDIEIRLGGVAYHFTVYPTKA